MSRASSAENSKGITPSGSRCCRCAESSVDACAAGGGGGGAAAAACGGSATAGSSIPRIS